MRRVAALAVTLTAVGAARAGAADWLAPTRPDPAPAYINTGDHLRPGLGAGDIAVLAEHTDLSLGAVLRPAGGAFGLEPLTGLDATVPPDLATDAQGNTVAVWRKGNAIHAAVRPAGGTFAVLDDALSPTAATDPRVAFTSDGTAVAVWTQANGIYGAVRPPGGTFAPEVPVFVSGSASASRPDIATDGHGDAMIAFLTHETSGMTYTNRARSLVRTPDGLLSAPQDISATTGSTASTAPEATLAAASVAMDAAGDAVAAVDEVSDSGTIFTTKLVGSVRLAATGTWNAPARLLDSATLQRNGANPPTGSSLGAGHPGYDTAGEAMIAWRKDVDTIKLSVAPAGAADLTSPVTVLTGTVGDPQIAPLPGGVELLLEADPTGVRWLTRPAGGAFGALRTIAVDSGPSALGLTTDAAGDAAAAWIAQNASEGASHLRLAIYDATPPVIGAVAVPATGAPGAPVALSADVFDAFSPVMAGWSFGDGASGGGASVTHAYGTPGTFAPALTATDAAGNAAAPVSRSIAIADAPVPTPTPSPSPTATPVAPVVQALSVTPARFRSRAKRARLRYRVSAAGAVRIVFTRAAKGREAGRRCVAATRARRRRPGCTRQVAAAVLSRDAPAGASALRFSTRVRHPGRYRVTAVETAGGLRSAPRSAAFRVLAR